MGNAIRKPIVLVRRARRFIRKAYLKWVSNTMISPTVSYYVGMNMDNVMNRAKRRAYKRVKKQEAKLWT